MVTGEVDALEPKILFSSILGVGTFEGIHGKFLLIEFVNILEY